MVSASTIGPLEVGANGCEEQSIVWTNSIRDKDKNKSEEEDHRLLQSLQFVMAQNEEDGTLV